MAEKDADKLAELLKDNALRERADMRQAFHSLRKLQAAYSHFVPKDFLEFLGAEDISDVMPGDEVEMNLTVMFSDIRNFTTLSERLTSHETFQFINAYLATMQSPIHRHGGTIDKFIGDAIMALFPSSADDALDAAISMLDSLKHYNANREKAGSAPIEMGIGLNTGLATLGVVGHSERMETTVIGDCVNVASRMEGLTKTYRTPILISEDTLIALSDQTKYCIRFIDRVHVKGRLRPLSVYEVFDGDTGKPAGDKLAGLEVFELAVAYYHLKEIEKALPLLEGYVEAIPHDHIAATYLERCRRYMRDGVYEGIGELEAQLAWEDSFNTGHPDIDRQHRHLLDNTNALSTALQAGDTDALQNVLTFMEQYTIEHFGTEQQLMERFQYPFAKVHTEEHGKFVKRFLSLAEELTSGSQDKLYSLFRVNLFLYDWLISHSTRVDKHLASYIAQAQGGDNGDPDIA